MRIEVYCDESGLEAFTNKEAHKYASIGGIWMFDHFRDQFKKDINALKEKHSFYTEIKWSRVGTKFIPFYKELIDYFFLQDELRFRTVIVEAAKVNHDRFSESDSELGFYKFYYQLLLHWTADNEYFIFVDHKSNRSNTRLHDLKRILEVTNIAATFFCLQALPSDQSLGIQMADFFTGLTTSYWNNAITADSKKILIDYCQEKLGRTLKPTYSTELKYNIFKINLEGSW